MKIVIASGKGGTGKTTVATNLALALRNKKHNVSLIDCDVEEPNAYLFIKPVMDISYEVGIPVPRIDFALCDYCGLCAERCVFNALAVIKDNVLIFDGICHGCGGCAYFCPVKAITEVERPIGVIEKGHIKGLNFVHGKLNPGEAMAPPLINKTKSEIRPDAITIIDAPPGTSCPVVASITGCDFCVLVTEPTPFGLNDLDLAVQLVKKMGIKTGVVINRCDMGDDKVEDYCLKNGLDILMKIPWNRDFAVTYAGGDTVVGEKENYWENAFYALFQKIADGVEGI